MGFGILYLCSAGRHHILLLSNVSCRHCKRSRKRPIRERSDPCWAQCSSIAGYLITQQSFIVILGVFVSFAVLSICPFFIVQPASGKMQTCKIVFMSKTAIVLLNSPMYDISEVICQYPPDAYVKKWGIC